jgi:hypothetical protein
MRRRPFRSQQPFEVRLAEEARRLKERAQTLCPSKERDALLRKVSQIELATHLNAWLTSPGLQPPR